MWIARSEDGNLSLHTTKPRYINGYWSCEITDGAFPPAGDMLDDLPCDDLILYANIFPSVVFENSPVELRLHFD